MNARFIITCAGSASRWSDEIGYPKHFVDVDGNRLIDRTCRQLLDRKSYSNLILADCFSYDSYGASLIVPIGPGPLPGSALGESYAYWAQYKPTVVLLGDVCWSDAAMDILFQNITLNKLLFFGRSGEDPKTKHGRELFGFIIPPHERETMWCHMAKANCHVKGAGGAGWYVYADLVGLNNNEWMESPYWREIADETSDFDTWDEYQAWLKAYRP